MVHIHTVEYCSAIKKKKKQLRIQQDEPQTLCQERGTEAFNERERTVSFHLYGVLAQAKLTYGGKSEQWFILGA